MYTYRIRRTTDKPKRTEPFNRSARWKELWAEPEWRDMMLTKLASTREKSKAAWADPERRAEMVEKNRQRVAIAHSDPVKKAKMFANLNKKKGGE